MLVLDRTAATALTGLHGTGTFLEGLGFRRECRSGGTKRHRQRQHQRREQQRNALAHRDSSLPSSLLLHIYPSLVAIRVLLLCSSLPFPLTPAANANNRLTPPPAALLRRM